MTNKFHTLFILLMVGFFATPSLAYSCGTKSTKIEKSCCKKSKPEKNTKKDCCKNHNSKNEKTKNSCNEKCTDSKCSCPTYTFAFASLFGSEIKAKTYFIESKKTKSYYNKNYHSDGFVSIWTPPDIA